MSLRRLGSLALLACLLALAGGSADAAKPKQAVFRVTLTASLTKHWTFTQVEEEEPGGCLLTSRGAGRWEAKLSTKQSSRVRAIAVSRGRVRFSGATVAALGGLAVQSGTMTTTATGPPPCERRSRSVRCGERRRKFKGASSMIGSPRKGVLQLGSLRGAAAIRSIQSDCLAEPADIRAIRTDLPLATAPVDAADVFGRNIPRFFSTADTEQVTTLEGDVEGRVTERVRWTVVFTRLKR